MSGTVSRTVIVVPCYNEAQRLSCETFRAFASRQPDVHFVFVDDGSTDRTAAILAELAQQNAARFTLISQHSNRGKASAVRAGMQTALRSEPRFAGYWDADLSTPLDEIPRFVETLEAHPRCKLAMGARVQLLGRAIRRRAVRHYAGRVFATAASSALGVAVYDTQCGAKLLRSDAETQALFAEPFSVNWTFDVELIARLLHARRLRGEPTDGAILELPLREWTHVPGSRVRPGDFLRAMAELWRIRRRYTAP